MIEMLGVLAIIGVLSVGGIAGYSKAMTKWKINKVAEQVASIVTNIKTLYAQQKSYEGLNKETAIEMGIIPDELLIEHLGGHLDISYNAYYSDAFVISLIDIPQEACISLATMDWRSSSGPIAFIVGNNWDTDITYTSDKDCKAGLYGGGVSVVALHCLGSSVVPMPMPAEIAVKACNCPQKTCSVRWKYY